ncbi:efflux RND transporter periplasmic adaptor subunit [Dyadobacter fanqingshengii]|uniref:Efflux RND transporter periplasmic adaptor subunit n=1 Tax=Dyadobacter fanqingshengii TaxID=2906443 RepID=A0A9X1T998_9BACT|nr:efflux RND transporter periplasmic adaptor subunit [Dyadobacter fanqingshengii]MCF0039709.1 efflux RND transporter periplasmic adaptor subunit [Dyadobacter fanqingshengii]USJ38528.1 efflux RND transporter periplasmic adaptor subunit [Dyadobacter fanqingshengii]
MGKRFIFILADIVTCLLVAFLVACSGNEKPQTAHPPASVPVVSLSAGQVTTYHDYPASIEAVANVLIRPQVSGYIDRVLVDEGAFVRKGQTLFKINGLLYREQLNAAIAGMHLAEALLINEQIETDKLKPLVQNKVISDYQLKIAEAALLMAKARLEQSQAAIASAKINLGYTTIQAPVSGYVGRLMKKQGTLVAPSDPAPLTELSDVSQLHVYFSLSEQDFVHFKAQYPGNSLSEKIEHVPEVDLVLSDESIFSQKGKIDIFDGQFDKNTGSITVRASFPNQQGLLRSGNTGKVRLGLHHRDAVLVPAAATLEMQDKVFVFALDEKNKVSKVAIQIVGKSGSSYLVKEGLKAGDRIVMRGMDHLQEGQTIRPEILMTYNNPRSELK